MINLTRREWLRKTVVFSGGLLAAKMGATAETVFPYEGIHLLAFGDFGSQNLEQQAVARSMAEFARKLGRPLTAVLGLGDNFYKTFTMERFRTGFEEMYDKEALRCPFYNCIGNHDYEYFQWDGEDNGPGLRKYEAELGYAKANPESRWKMPAKWYSVKLPEGREPLVKVIVLDTNFEPGMLTPSEKLQQRRFLEKELKIGTARWTWIVGHHPIYTAAPVNEDRDQETKLWLKDYLKAYPVSFYFAGHDHNLQHIEVEGYHTSFVISGGGGGSLYGVRATDHFFSRSVLGFNHMHVTRDWIDTQYIDVEGRRIHAFRRTRDGEMRVLSQSDAA